MHVLAYNLYRRTKYYEPPGVSFGTTAYKKKKKSIERRLETTNDACFVRRNWSLRQSTRTWWRAPRGIRRCSCSTMMAKWLCWPKTSNTKKRITFKNISFDPSYPHAVRKRTTTILSREIEPNAIKLYINNIPIYRRYIIIRTAAARLVRRSTFYKISKTSYSYNIMRVSHCRPNPPPPPPKARPFRKRLVFLNALSTTTAAAVGQRLRITIMFTRKNNPTQTLNGCTTSDLWRKRRSTQCSLDRFRHRTFAAMYR